MDDEREEELQTLAAIFPEVLIDASDAFTATLELPVSPAKPLTIKFASPDQLQESYLPNYPAECIRELSFAHLPPFTVHITLPLGYPTDRPPIVKLSTRLDWLPESKTIQLEHDVLDLWQECGRCQILFSYIDHLQQAAERGFDLDGRLTLSAVRESDLVTFNRRSLETIFNAGTYHCGICLDPKKGKDCASLPRCVLRL